MKIKKEKINVKKYLGNKDREYNYFFENTFINFFSIPRKEFYENYNNFEIFKKDLKKINKIIKFDIKNKDSTFLYKFKWFDSEKFRIKKGVFVPQPDTEGLISLVFNDFEKGTFLEIGSGVGNISISLVKKGEFNSEAFDINGKAIKLSKENYLLKKPFLKGEIVFIKKDFTKYNFNKKYDFIISNPPYLNKGDKNISKWVKKHQPKKALYAPNNELYFYKKIFDLSKNILNNNGKIYLEIGFNQKEKLEELIKKYNFKLYNFYKDYGNNYRYLVINV